MDALTKQLLREAGFETGSERDLLGLSAAQDTVVEMKVRLTALLRQERQARSWTQAKLAQALDTRQQVVARAEMGHRSVTLDLLLRALLALGVKLSLITRELEACEAYLAEQESGQAVELVALPGLIRPERVAAHTTIADAGALMRLVRGDLLDGDLREVPAVSANGSSNGVALEAKHDAVAA